MYMAGILSNAVAKDIKVTSGVPQGSHLGPLCFIWFVNRISEIFDYDEALSSCQWISKLFENSVGSEQTVGVVRQKLIAPQRW
jgi:hypothetical protein